jgi:hypothetical protein
MLNLLLCQEMVVKENILQYLEHLLDMLVAEVVDILMIAGRLLRALEQELKAAVMAVMIIQALMEVADFQVQSTPEAVVVVVEAVKMLLI